MWLCIKTIVTERTFCSPLSCLCRLNRHHHYSTILNLHSSWLGWQSHLICEYTMLHIYDIKDTREIAAAVLLYSKYHQNGAISYTNCKQNVANNMSFSRWRSFGLTKKNHFSININGLYIYASHVGMGYLRKFLFFPDIFWEFP